MCDTVVLVNKQGVWFAKNSDREPNEAQVVVRIPAVRGDRSRGVRLTHIPIRQVPNRHAVILSKPHWMWGAEMGINEHGVVIGNEAIFSRVRNGKPGMLGMDLVRLGLERGATAAEALKVMTRLIEQVGQGGAAGFKDKGMHYDNSFIIADKQEAWVLESVQRQWVSKRVETTAAISNCLTLDSDYDDHSADLETYAYLKNHAVKDGKKLDFAASFDTKLMPRFAKAHERLASSNAWLERAYDQLDGEVSLQAMAKHLRSHAYDNAEHKAGKAPGPADGSNADICMHAAGPIRRSQTCGSMIAHLSEARISSLFTGTSAPCMSIFRPADFDFEQDYSVLAAEDAPMEESLWAEHESLHHRALFDIDFRHQLRTSRDDVETRMFDALTAEDALPIGAADLLAQQWYEGQKWVTKRKPHKNPINLRSLYWRRKRVKAQPKKVKKQRKVVTPSSPHRTVME